MPVVRLSTRRASVRRRSSAFKIRSGAFGITRPVTFAPNVTPVSYVDADGTSACSTPEPSSPSAALFPPSEAPAPPPARKRCPPGKRRSMGYIPRPPNAFMLFRADFVRQKHVPGTIETNHGSLSKIIGNCWRSLPLEEKRVWEVKAKHAKAEHKARYPDYRFRPVHNKNKEKKNKAATTVEDERRCEEVAQLLLEGKKGDELAAAVRNLDMLRSNTPSVPRHPANQHRRSSSVPLPNDYYYPQFSNIEIPSAPFLSMSRPESPMQIDNIARQQQRMMLGNRRASSARPAPLNRSWTVPMTAVLQRDDSPLPEVDTSLFNPIFLEGTNPGFSFTMFNDQFDGPATSQPSQLHHDQNNFGPLENIAPHEIIANQNMFSTSSTHAPEFDPLSWMDAAHVSSQNGSHPSTAYSGSPEPSEEAVLHAPQPQSATSNAFADMWKEFGGGSFTSGFLQHQQFTVDAGLGLDFNPSCGTEVNLNLGCEQPSHGLDNLFQPMFHDGFAPEYHDMNLGVLHA